MLPAANRMRRSTDFATVVRAGVRVREHRLVLHQLTSPARPAEPDADAGVASRGAAHTADVDAPLIGLIIGKSIGGSVVRHRVSRRLRAQLSDRLDHFPAGSRTVVRGLPGAGDASSFELGHDLDRAMARAARASRRVR